MFFLDDRHLSLGSLGRTRNTVSNFIDKEMGQNDLVAIASSSGQIGFLQQFTDNKEVLRATIERINHVPYVVTDYGGNPGSPMTENMALIIERKTIRTSLNSTYKIACGRRREVSADRGARRCAATAK